MNIIIFITAIVISSDTRVTASSVPLAFDKFSQSVTNCLIVHYQFAVFPDVLRSEYPNNLDGFSIFLWSNHLSILHVLKDINPETAEKARFVFLSVSNLPRKYTQSCLIYLQYFKGYTDFIQWGPENDRNLIDFLHRTLLPTRSPLTTENHLDIMYGSPTAVIAVLGTTPIAILETFAASFFSTLQHVLFYGTQFFSVHGANEQIYCVCLYCHLIEEINLKQALFPVVVHDETFPQKAMSDSWEILQKNLLGLQVVSRMDGTTQLPDGEIQNCGHRVYGIGAENGFRPVRWPHDCVVYTLTQFMNFTIIRVEREIGKEKLQIHVDAFWKTSYMIYNQFIIKANADRYSISGYCADYMEYGLKIFIHKNITASNVLIAMTTPFDGYVWSILFILAALLVLFYAATFQNDSKLVTVEKYKRTLKESLEVSIHISGVFVSQFNPQFFDKCRKIGQSHGILLITWIFLVTLLSWIYSGKCVSYFATRHVPQLPQNVYELVNLRSDNLASGAVVPRIPLVTTSRWYGSNQGGYTYMKEQTLQFRITVQAEESKDTKIGQKLYQKHLSVHNNLLELSGISIYDFFFRATHHLPVPIKWDKLNPQQYEMASMKFPITFPGIWAVLDLKSDIATFESAAERSQMYELSPATNKYEHGIDFDDSITVFGLQNKFLAYKFIWVVKHLDNSGIFNRWREQRVTADYLHSPFSGNKNWLNTLNDFGLKFPKTNVEVSLNMNNLASVLVWLCGIFALSGLAFVFEHLM